MRPDVKTIAQKREKSSHKVIILWTPYDQRFWRDHPALSEENAVGGEGVDDSERAGEGGGGIQRWQPNADFEELTIMFIGTRLKGAREAMNLPPGTVGCRTDWKSVLRRCSPAPQIEGVKYCQILTFPLPGA
jgi:hypothetical protein